MLCWFSKDKPLTVNELCELFLAATVNRWKKPIFGRSHSRERYVFALKAFCCELGEQNANSVSKRQIKDFRDTIAKKRNSRFPEQPLSRRYVNQFLLCVKEVYRWGYRTEHVTEEEMEMVSAVPIIKKGDTDLREPVPVTSVSIDTVEKTLPFVVAPIADMCRVHYLTGMRSGELCQMRPVDLMDEGVVLRYIPQTHKTEHHGKRRIIYIGPKARTILQPYIDACQSPDEHLWSPRKTMIFLHGKCPARQSGDRYTTPLYYGHLYRAIKRAGVEHWHPHQLRHAFATIAAKGYDLESVKEVLGHSSVAITEIYVDPSFERAKKVVAAIG